MSVDSNSATETWFVIDCAAVKIVPCDPLFIARKCDDKRIPSPPKVPFIMKKRLLGLNFLEWVTFSVRVVMIL